MSRSTRGAGHLLPAGVDSAIPSGSGAQYRRRWTRDRLARLLARSGYIADAGPISRGCSLNKERAGRRHGSARTWLSRTKLFDHSGMGMGVRCLDRGWLPLRLQSLSDSAPWLRLSVGAANSARHSKAEG